MRYEWDPEKARANLRKHGVSFADAVSVLEDAAALTRDDEHAAEHRYVTLGADALGRMLVVAWTPRGASIRLISARKATPRERRQYEGEEQS